MVTFKPLPGSMGARLLAAARKARAQETCAPGAKADGQPSAQDTFGEAPGLNVVIDGAGVGGLTTAVALLKQGLAPQNLKIYEKRAADAEGRPVVYNVRNDSVATLKQLGVHDALIGEGQAGPIRTLAFVDLNTGHTDTRQGPRGLSRSSQGTSSSNEELLARPSVTQIGLSDVEEALRAELKRFGVEPQFNMELVDAQPDGHYRVRNTVTGQESVGKADLGFVAEGANSNFRNNNAEHFGWKPTTESAHFIAGVLRHMVGPTLTRIVKTEDDESYTRGIAVGHASKKTVWGLVQVPESEVGRLKADKQAARDYYLSFMSRVLAHVPGTYAPLTRYDIVPFKSAGGNKVFEVSAGIVQRAVMGVWALVGDSAGKSHFLTSAGFNTIIAYHALSAQRLTQRLQRCAKDDEVGKRLAFAIYEFEILASVQAWLDVGTEEFSGKEPINFGRQLRNIPQSVMQLAHGQASSALAWAADGAASAEEVQEAMQQIGMAAALGNSEFAPLINVFAHSGNPVQQQAARDVLAALESITGEKPITEIDAEDTDLFRTCEALLAAHGSTLGEPLKSSAVMIALDRRLGSLLRSAESQLRGEQRYALFGTSLTTQVDNLCDLLNGWGPFKGGDKVSAAELLTIMLAAFDESRSRAQRIPALVQRLASTLGVDFTNEAFQPISETIPGFVLRGDFAGADQVQRFLREVGGTRGYALSQSTHDAMVAAHYTRWDETVKRYFNSGIYAYGGGYYELTNTVHAAVKYVSTAALPCKPREDVGDLIANTVIASLANGTDRTPAGAVTTIDNLTQAMKVNLPKEHYASIIDRCLALIGEVQASAHGAWLGGLETLSKGAGLPFPQHVADKVLEDLRNGLQHNGPYHGHKKLASFLTTVQQRGATLPVIMGESLVAWLEKRGTLQGLSLGVAALEPMIEDISPALCGRVVEAGHNLIRSQVPRDGLQHMSAIMATIAPFEAKAGSIASKRVLADVAVLSLRAAIGDARSNALSTTRERFATVKHMYEAAQANEEFPQVDDFVVGVMDYADQISLRGAFDDAREAIGLAERAVTDAGLTMVASAYDESVDAGLKAIARFVPSAFTKDIEQGVAYVKYLIAARQALGAPAYESSTFAASVDMLIASRPQLRATLEDLLATLRVPSAQ